MGTYTTNLGLYNTNMSTDGNDTFDFKRDINDNNDILDSAIGKLSTLTTTDKQSLVNAINEIVSSLGNFSTKDLDNLSATGQAIIDKKVEVEALLAQNGYAKFSWKENNQISKLIFCWKIVSSNTTVTANSIDTISAQFPITFNNVFGAVATANIGTRTVVYYISSLTTTGCSIVFKNLTATNCTSRNAIILTIGN